MILIGGYFSPFVRRCAVTMRSYEIPYEHRPLKVWDQATEVRAANPLGRVPALIIDENETLVDSSVIIDALDHMVAEDKVLTPRQGYERRHVMTLVEVGAGAAEKAVSAQYERVYRPPEKIHQPWIEHCEEQARGGFEALERMAVLPWMAGKEMTQADITTVVVWEFVNLINPELFSQMECPKLRKIVSNLTNTEPFKETRPEI